VLATIPLVVALALASVGFMLSIVIPVYNERESLAPLHAELAEVARDRGYDLDIIFVDDGSSDDSWREIESLAERDPRISGVRFRRNFGKAAALSAGFEQARGDLVMTLDADLQDNPAEIPLFLDAIAGGLDVVSGWKQVRYDPWHKVGPSRVFNWMVSKLTGVALHDHNCGMKCCRREVLNEVRLYGELHRFVPVLAAARGFRVGEVVVRHRPRRYGQSKYGVNRIVKGFLDLLTVRFLTGFGQRPQHLLGAAGLVCFVAGLTGLGYLALDNVLAALAPGSQLSWLDPQRAFLGAAMFILLGVQLMSLGLVAELIVDRSSRGSDRYSVAQIVSRGAAQPVPPSDSANGAVHGASRPQVGSRAP
jgi:dolichol-phosphate mannosyltransferase